MKFIFSFLLIFTFLSPVYAGYAPGTTAQTCSAATNCNATPGCRFVAGECSPCASGTANPGGSNSQGCTSCSGNADYQPIINDQTKQHPDGAASCNDWVCATDYTLIGSSCLQCSTTIPNNSHYVTDCNHWACDAGYYRYTNDDNEDVCGQCPQNSTSAPGATSINQCSCDTGYKKLLDRDNNWIFSANGCIATLPSGNWVPSSNNSNEYKCADHATLSITSSSVTCQCPTYSTVPSNSNDCVCGNDNNNNPTHFIGTTDNYTCSACHEHSTWNNSLNICVCETGYFPNNTSTACMECPDGINIDIKSYSDTTNISTCAFFCEDNKKLIKTPDNKYYCGFCGIGTQTTNNDVTTCNCAAAGANNQSLEAISTSGQQCACPNGASNSNNKCVCNTSPATILKTSSNNTFSCVSCSNIVTNSIFQAGSSGTTSVVYTDGGPNACICDFGYYKNGNRNECTNCPIGLTTTDSGATSRNACQMPKTVKLCLVTNNTNRTTSNATKCMQPIPVSDSVAMTDIWPPAD